MSALTDHADKLRTVIDIAEVVGRYVELRRAGINMKGLCPFHREKSPSFTVNQPKGIFHCFGCGEGGDAIKFIQKIERLEWVEALRLLSEQNGMPMPEREHAGDPALRDQARDERERLLEVSKMAAEHFAARLLETMKDPSAEITRYLQRRRIDADAVQQFQIGVAADAWQDLLDAGKRADWGEEILLAAGLVIRNPDKKRVYDRFRKRLIFPVHDNVGRPIAFGGRVYAADASPEEPKYVNSPETPLYRKGQQLYALHLAKEPIVRNKRALLMEGYMDVIRAHRSGFPEAVATCGTALTDEQAKALRRYTDTVYFVYDGDAAGQKAMHRGTEVLLDHGFTVKVVALPGDHDPDSFLVEQGPEAFASAIDKAAPFLDFFLDAASAAHGRSSPEAKVKIVEDVMPLLRRVHNEIAASEYARRTADFLDLEVALVLAQLRKVPTRVGPELREQIVTVRPAAELPPLRDRMILRLILESAHARACLFEQIELCWLEHERVRWFFERARQVDDDSLLCHDYLYSLAETEDDRALLRAVAMESEDLDDSDRTLNNLIARIRRHGISVGTERLRRDLKQSADRHPDAPADETDPAAGGQRPILQKIDALTRPLNTVSRDYFMKPDNHGPK